MLKYLSQLLNDLEAIIKKFFGVDNPTGTNWQHQTSPASGIFGDSSRKTAGVSTRAVHPAQVKKYTPEEVKRCLRGLEQGERVGPVMVEASRFGSVVNEGMRRYFRGRERIFERLPYVLYQYTQGKPSQEIARGVSYFSDANDVEEAMSFACRIIAARVNRMR